MQKKKEAHPNPDKQSGTTPIDPLHIYLLPYS